MVFPDYVTTRAVTAGGAFTLESADLLKVRLTVTASKSLVRDSNGVRFERRPLTDTSELGSEVSIKLPVTDQAGWRDAGTGQLIDVSAPDSFTHKYTALLELIDDQGRVLAGSQVRLGPFVVPTGDLTPIDLDKTIPTSTVAGEQVAVPDLWGQLVAAAAEYAEQAASAADLIEPALGDISDLKTKTTTGYLSEAGISGAIDGRVTSQKGQPNGLPTLGADGKVPTTQLPAASGGTDVAKILQAGDSLTENWGSNNNNIEIRDAFGSTNVTNIGKGGQTSPQIAARQGGVPAMLTLSGGKLPASGGVTVTSDTNLFYMNATSGSWTQDGLLLGVPGTLSVSKTSGVYTYTFTRTNPGLEVAAPNPAPFLTGQAWRSRALTIGVGRNNFKTSTPAQIVEHVRGIIEWSTRNPSDHIVLSIPPSTVETPGTADRTLLDAANAALAAAFPRQWVDWAGYLRSEVTLGQAGIAPTSQDLTDIANAVTPTSFRGAGDNLHFNAAAYDVINTLILAAFAARGVLGSAAPTSPAITTASLPEMTVGNTVSQGLAASGSTPLTWSVVSGALPAGVSLSGLGVLSGTPTAAGAYSVTIRAANTAGSNDKTFSGTVASAALYGYGLTDAKHRYVGAQLPAVAAAGTPWPDAIGSLTLTNATTTLKVGDGPGGVDKSLDTPNTATAANSQRVLNTTGDNTVRTIALIVNNRTPANVAHDLVSIGNGYLKLFRGANGQIAVSATGIGSVLQQSVVAGWRVVFAWFDEAASELGLDATGSEVTATGTRGSAPGSTFAVGGGATAAIDIGIAEVLLWDRVLTDSERTAVRTALAAHFPAITA